MFRILKTGDIAAAYMLIRASGPLNKFGASELQPADRLPPICQLRNLQRQVIRARPAQRLLGREHDVIETHTVITCDQAGVLRTSDDGLCKRD
jgi:hypothetical protein